MHIVMDDVVGTPTFEKDCLQILESNKRKTNQTNFNEKWYSLEEEHAFQDFSLKLIEVASNFYDLTSCIGYELSLIHI